MISINGVAIVPTIFPDKTSQVWKLPADLLEKCYKDYAITVVWDFEGEAEFIHLAQLKTLLDTYTPIVYLEMPYLPYGRQDKRVDNGSTFALTTFAKLLNSLKFTEVRVLDAHNNMRAHAIEHLEDNSPRSFIERAFMTSGANLLLFPDAGALERYGAYKIARSVYAEKIREQKSGNILSMEIKGVVRGMRVLIVDDIADGGMTFKLVAEEAIRKGAKEVYLYVTHGIFSKGLAPMQEAGITRFFTYKGEIDTHDLSKCPMPVLASTR